MKFIRKNGRLIPIKEKGDGNVDKRHVSSKMLADAATKKNPNKTAQVIGTLTGASAAALATFKKTTSIRTPFVLTKKGVMQGLPTITKTKSVSGVAMALGALAGYAIGSTTFTKKQDVANKLKKKK